MCEKEKIKEKEIKGIKSIKISLNKETQFIN